MSDARAQELSASCACRGVGWSASMHGGDGFWSGSVEERDGAADLCARVQSPPPITRARHPHEKLQGSGLRGEANVRGPAVQGRRVGMGAGTVVLSVRPTLRPPVRVLCVRARDARTWGASERERRETRAPARGRRPLAPFLERWTFAVRTLDVGRLDVGRYVRFFSVVWGWFFFFLRFGGFEQPSALTLHHTSPLWSASGCDAQRTRSGLQRSGWRLWGARSAVMRTGIGGPGFYQQQT